MIRHTRHYLHPSMPKATQKDREWWRRRMARLTDGGGVGADVDNLLLEDGFNLLLEDGTSVLKLE